MNKLSVLVGRYSNSSCLFDKLLSKFLVSNLITCEKESGAVRQLAQL
jgi:hypothetical protein